jgi:ABC-type branched-subunit amino acid transport system substrate-binding protein
MPRRRQAPLSIKNIFAVLMLAVIAGCSTIDTAPNGPPVDYNQAIRAKTEGARLAGPVIDPQAIGDKAPDQVYDQPIAGDDRPRTRPVKVALLLPLTGQGADIGQSMMRAAEIATFQLADQNFTLVPLDTKSSAEGARAAIEAAIAQNVELVLGPLFSSEVTAIREPAKQAGLNVLSFTTDRQQAGDNIFVMGFLPSTQIERIMAYARARGAERFGVLAPEGAYGDAVLDAARAAVNLYGGTITKLTRYKADIVNFKPVVNEFTDMAARQEKLSDQRNRLAMSDQPAARRALNDLANKPAAADLPYQAALIADGGNRLAIIAPLLAEDGLTPDRVQWLGTGLWEDAASWQLPALAGAWYAAPEISARLDFEQRYKTGYGESPLRIASLAYDAAALAAVIARQDVDLFSGDKEVREAAWTSLIYRRDVLTNPNGFIGADGVFRFLPDGTVERGLAVMEIAPSGPIVRDTAPQSFEVPGL